MSVPSVGPVTSVRFAAAIDDVTRFPSAHAVESFLGLTPGEIRVLSASSAPASPRPGQQQRVELSFKLRGIYGARARFIPSVSQSRRSSSDEANSSRPSP
jgi:hypothetical protein